MLDEVAVVGQLSAQLRLFIISLRSRLKIRESNPESNGMLGRQMKGSSLDATQLSV
jgi:hypothetical protein